MASRKIFTTIFVYYFISLVGSCDENSFYNVKVTLKGVKDITNITGCFEPVEDLVNVSYIQIIDEQIPVLKKNAIHSLPKLVDIVLESNNIAEIKPGAFLNLTNLYLLKIRYNSIRNIQEGVFNGLPLTELSLTNNSIETIHPRAFDDMPNLSVLFLNENKITLLSTEWFKNSPNVGMLNFEKNYITTIPLKVFQNVKGEHLIRNINVLTNILLNDNVIRKIEDGAFDALETLGWLFLHKNEIEDISEESLGSLRAIEWVRLDHNKLKCVPEKLVQISPKIVYYLQSNPLTEFCINKYNITKVR
nr:insulin-like growth factor-binding protein complex acid labile subunit [Leptinotarsa decemlineata]